MADPQPHVEVAVDPGTHEREQQDDDEPVLESTLKDPAEVAAAIRKQVEFYFSDANLPTDKHLMKQLRKDPEGWVPVKLVANFKRVKALSKDLGTVVAALRGSSAVVLDEPGKRMRRAAALPEYDIEDIQRRTVLVEHLPPSPTIESVTSLFCQYGEVRMVRICSKAQATKLPAWLAGAAQQVNWASQQFALVEFVSEEAAAAAVERTSNPDNWRTSLRCRHLLPGKPRGPGGRSDEHHAGGHGGSHGGGGHAGHGGGSGGSFSGGGGKHGSHVSHGGHAGGGQGAASHGGGATGGQGGGRNASTAGSGGARRTPEPAQHAGMDGLPKLPQIRTTAPAAGTNGAGGARQHSPLRNGSSAGGAPATAAPASAALLSPSRATGVGGAIVSPRTAPSPAAPAVAALIDQILAGPTGPASPAARGSPRVGSAFGAPGGSSGGGGSGTPTRLGLTAAAAAPAVAASSPTKRDAAAAAPGSAALGLAAAQGASIRGGAAGPPARGGDAGAQQLVRTRSGRVRRVSWHAGGGDEEEAVGALASEAAAATPYGLPLQAGSLQATIQAIRQASVELDPAVVAAALGAGAGGGRARNRGGGGDARRGQRPRRLSDLGGAPAPAPEGGRRQRQRQRKPTGRPSLDLQDGPAASGASGSADEVRAPGKAKDKDKDKDKKKEKKDYASWAAATPQFRAEAAAAARHGGTSGGGSGSGIALGTSPARAGLSPLRMATGGGGGEDAVRVPRMPDGTRGFGFGRGRTMAPP